MGKIKSGDHALSIIMEKGHAEGSTFRSQEPIRGERVESGATTDSWYRELKLARANFSECSRGQVDILSSVYDGDEHRHQVFHTGCGHHSWTSLLELQASPLERCCPHCHGTEELARFGTIENLQVAVYRMSGGSAYFYAANPLEEAEKEYRFFCSLHGRSYRATWSQFWNAAGKTNGCPICAVSKGA